MYVTPTKSTTPSNERSAAINNRSPGYSNINLVSPPNWNNVTLLEISVSEPRSER